MRRRTDFNLARGRWDARRRSPRSPRGSFWQRHQYRKGYRQALREMRREGWA